MKKDTKFKPGQSGNPNGRPKGSKDKRTAYREFFEKESEELIKIVIAKAKEGDITCLKMCIDRIASPLRSTDQTISLGEFTGTLSQRGEKVIQAMSEGLVTPTDASSMLTTLAAQARIIEIDDLDKRISVLEKRNGA